MNDDLADMDISVIICTHNPRPDYLRKVLDALNLQQLSKDCWELLFVDNASHELLSDRWDLSWHPNARHFREDILGLTPARVRGIREAIGSILVFVDDDNILAADYLTNALKIAGKWMILGAWGGRVVGEFETLPPPWASQYLDLLAIREIVEDRWSNNRQDWSSQPCGAGLCVRNSVAQRYVEEISLDPTRRMLDRRGSELTSCGDSDLVQTSCRLELGFGVFTSLTLVHLIPKERVDQRYLMKLVRGIRTSALLLRYLQDGLVPRMDNSFSARVRRLLRLIVANRRDRGFQRAELQAHIDARDIALKLEKEKRA